MSYIINIVNDYVQPTAAIDTNEGYVDMVMNMAAKSYQSQYNTATSEEGVTAAREAFNAQFPVVPDVVV